MKKVRLPTDTSKLYGNLTYHEWFFEFDSVNDLFTAVINLHKTEAWWDYDGFSVVKIPPNWSENLEDLEEVNWREMLTDEHRVEEKKWAAFNFELARTERGLR